MQRLFGYDAARATSSSKVSNPCMRFSTRYLFAILLLTLGLPTLLAGQSPPQQNKAARSSVSGRVTIKEKGVAGVVVALRKGEGAMPYEPLQRATTDQDGNYRITNVAPGTYEVIPSAPAYVMAGERIVRSRAVLVAEDDNLEGINFTLVRGGVITGRITDADGRPMIQQPVTIFGDNSLAAATQPQRQQRKLFPYTTVQTDDRGIYRVFGLPMGRYKVASGRSDDPELAAPNFGRSVYGQVFHPNVSEADKATVIEVNEGSEANDIDITLGRPLQTFSATGRVMDTDRQVPVPNLRFTLQRWVGQRAEFINSSTASNAQGDFIVEGLIPGKYSAYIYQNQNNEMRPEPTSFEIIDQDLTGVVIKLARGASVTGVVVLETENKAVLGKLSELQMRGFISTPLGGGLVSSATSPIAPDGSFRLAGLTSGNLILNLGSGNSPMSPKGFRITRLERDGVVLTGALEVKDGEQLTGVRVILTYATASLRGVVTVDNGPLPAGANVSVRLVKPGQQTGPRPTMVDERGRFLIEGIPAGSYELITVVTMGVTRSASRTVKQIVNIQDGATTDLTIAVEMPAQANP